MLTGSLLLCTNHVMTSWWHRAVLHKIPLHSLHSLPLFIYFLTVGPQPVVWCSNDHIVLSPLCPAMFLWTFFTSCRVHHQVLPPSFIWPLPLCFAAYASKHHPHVLVPIWAYVQHQSHPRHRNRYWTWHSFQSARIKLQGKALPILLSIALYNSICNEYDKLIISDGNTPKAWIGCFENILLRNIWGVMCHTTMTTTTKNISFSDLLFHKVIVTKQYLWILLFKLIATMWQLIYCTRMQWVTGLDLIPTPFLHFEQKRWWL